MLLMMLLLVTINVLNGIIDLFGELISLIRRLRDKLRKNKEVKQKPKIEKKGKQNRKILKEESSLLV